MLKLRDFLHLPQLDSLVEELVNDQAGLIVLAGIDARPTAAQPAESFTPSGLSAIFNILIQEILLTHPLIQAIIVSEDRSLAKVPRQINRRVRLLQVDSENSYAHQIEMGMHLKPGLLVVDRMCEESVPSAFLAAHTGLRVLARMDTILRGPSVARQLVEMGAPHEQLPALGWILTNQRMSVLCDHCRRPVETDDQLYERLHNRFPHLPHVIEQFREPHPGQGASAAKGERSGEGGRRNKPAAFFRASGCDHCHGTGYAGDIAVFDIFHNQPGQADFFAQASMLPLEEYALHLAAQGELDIDDLMDLENDHLRRTFQMLTASERALTRSNTELSRKLLELETSNRVLVQRTEVLVSLQDLGQALISSTDLRELADRISRRASEMCGANRVVLYLYRRAFDGREVAEILAERGWGAYLIGQQLERKQVYDPHYENRTMRYMDTPPGFRSAAAAGAELRPNSIQVGLCVPLIAQDQHVGVMIIQSTQKDHFTQGEMALLQTFANQAALGIQRAGLVEELRAKIAELEAAQVELVKKERLDRELELARQVQQSLLPRNFPSISGYLFSARNEPARQVGGDFYDVIHLDDSHFGIVIADVADKGMPAALYMALTRSLLLAEARRALSPRAALLNVNRLLLELGDLNGFVSIFYGVVACDTRQITYVRAGHERPLLVRGGEARLLAGEGAVLGVLEAEQLNLTEEQMELLPGDRLVLYTDGITDVEDAQGKFSGHALLTAILHERSNLSADDICSAVFSDLAAYRGQAEQFDDMTLLVLEVEP